MRLWGFLYEPDGRARTMRLVVTLIVLVALAFFGTVLLFATPAVSGSTPVQVAWVLFGVVGLKLPLILLLWHFVMRNREWPGRRPEWSRRESREILAYIQMEAARAESHPDAEARLAYLSGEAWNVADALGGEEKVDALTVALAVDERRARLAGKDR
ncbi:MAG: hypothetical protein AB1416_08415 [Actinomycetota bacterium]